MEGEKWERVTVIPDVFEGEANWTFISDEGNYSIRFASDKLTGFAVGAKGKIARVDF